MGHVEDSALCLAHSECQQLLSPQQMVAGVVWSLGWEGCSAECGGQEGRWVCGKACLSVRRRAAGGHQVSAVWS